MKFNDEQEYTNRNIDLNSEMNNLMFSIDIKLSNIFSQFGYSISWKKFFIKMKKQDMHPTKVVVEFTVNEGGRNAIDWVDCVLDSLNVDFKYINLSTLDLIKSLPISHGNSGKILIKI